MTTLSPHKPSSGIAAIRRLMQLAAAAAMLAAAVSSCDSVIYDNPDDPSPVGPQELTATLQFQVASNAPISSRALNEAENDADHKAGTADENYVDLQTLSFILADGNGNAIMPFYPSVTPDAASDYKTYTVISELPQAALNKTVTDGYASFQILVIANARTNGVERMPYGFSLESYDTNKPELSSFFGSAGSPTFQFPLAGNTDASWSPSIAAAQYIPMAGVQNFSVSVSDLEASTPESPFRLYEGDNGKMINLLRAVARVDVKLSAASADAGISISRVTLTGYNTRGALLPEASAWQTGNLFETQYMLDSDAPTIPSNNSYANTALPLVHITKEGDNNVDYWSIYLPEYDLTQTPTPKFTVKFAQKQGEVTTELPGEDTFTLSKYVDGTVGAPINLIRNNLYTYELTKTTTTSEDASISINWTVCPMDNKTINIPDYFE